ncbi:hypothetical protein [Sphingobacterium hungaricum]
MNKILLVALLSVVVSCENKKPSSQKVDSSKVYTYDFQSDSIHPIDVSAYYSNEEFKLEKQLIPINKEEFDKDSADFTNNFISKPDLLEDRDSLALPYGTIKFIKRKQRDRDDFTDYRYMGFAPNLDSHLLSIDLYDGSYTLILNDKLYTYGVVDGEPIFSLDNKNFATFRNDEGHSSSLTLYAISEQSFSFEKFLWSDEHLIESVFWNSENKLVISLLAIESGATTYYKINI